MDINGLQFDDLLAEGLPVHVAARVSEELKTNGPYLGFSDLLARLYYATASAPTARGSGSAMSNRPRRPDVRPADQRLMSDLGLVIEGAKDPQPVAKDTPWWEWPVQAAGNGASGNTLVDDAFPAGEPNRMGGAQPHVHG